MYPFLSIGGFTLELYPFFMAVGYIAGMLLVYFRKKVTKLRWGEILLCDALAGIFAMLGGQIASMISQLPMYFEYYLPAGKNLIDFYKDAGSIYYGILAGSFLGVFIYTKIYKKPFWVFIDTLMPGLALTQMFGRIGCFCAGCCYGIPWQHGMYFSRFGIAPPGIKLLPLQLIESGACLVIFIILMAKGRRMRPPGYLVGMYLILYSAARFALEFFRGDGKSSLAGPFTVQQWISLGILVMGILFYLYAKGKLQPRSGKREPMSYQV